MLVSRRFGRQGTVKVARRRSFLVRPELQGEGTGRLERSLDSTVYQGIQKTKQEVLVQIWEVQGWIFCA